MDPEHALFEREDKRVIQKNWQEMIKPGGLDIRPGSGVAAAQDVYRKSQTPQAREAAE